MFLPTPFLTTPPPPWTTPSARQSFAVLRGAVLGLQDDDDGDHDKDATEEASMELEPGEEQPVADQTDGQGSQKQGPSQHLHHMVELLRPQDDIRLVRGPFPPRSLFSAHRDSGGPSDAVCWGQWGHARARSWARQLGAGAQS